MTPFNDVGTSQTQTNEEGKRKKQSHYGESLNSDTENNNEGKK